MAYLIGDILSVSKTDVLLIWLGLGLVLLLLFWRWSALLLCTLNEDLAAASGLNPKRENFILTIALAVVVAVGIKVVGVNTHNKNKGGSEKSYSARLEVILCAGALNTPGLLERCGVGRTVGP